MKKVHCGFAIIFICFISSCIPSIHGIVTEDDRITDDRIIGNWTSISNVDNLMQSNVQVSPKRIEGGDKDISWTIERAANFTFKTGDTEKQHTVKGVPGSFLPAGAYDITSVDLDYYILTHRERIEGDTIINHIQIGITQIGAEMFAEFLPFGEKDKRLQGYFAPNYLNAYTFAKMTFIDDRLVFDPLDGSRITDLIDQKRIRLKHERRINDDIILTASTSELRSFIANYLNEPGLYEEGDELVKITWEE